MDNQSNIVGGEEEIILEPEMFGGAPGTTDFNELENRPSYAGEVMTGETNIPAVPTAVSELTNDSGYQTADDVADAVGIEATARQNADNGLQGQIDALAAASDVTDIVGTKADLDAYDTSKLKDNDIIKVLQDESQDDETTYYRWSTTTETFTLIGAEGPYYTKSATDQLLQAKQDKLTAGANITIDENNEISATDTTYSAFTGTDGVDAGTSGLVPAPATTDAGKYLKADGTWDSVPTPPTVVQTEGSSTTDVMSQNATTSMVFADPSTRYKIRIGANSTASGASGIAVGGLATASGGKSVAFGEAATASKQGSIAIGPYSNTTSVGEVNIGSSSSTAFGYNSSNYRLLTGLYDPQSAHDAATKGYVDAIVITNAGAPTTATVGTVGQLLEDTTNGKLYICTAVIPGTDPDPTTYTWVEVKTHKETRLFCYANYYTGYEKSVLILSQEGSGASVTVSDMEVYHAFMEQYNATTIEVDGMGSTWFVRAGDFDDMVQAQDFESLCGLVLDMGDAFRVTLGEGWLVDTTSQTQNIEYITISQVQNTTARNSAEAMSKVLVFGENNDTEIPYAAIRTWTLTLGDSGTSDRDSIYELPQNFLAFSPNLTEISISYADSGQDIRLAKGSLQSCSQLQKAMIADTALYSRPIIVGNSVLSNCPVLQWFSPSDVGNCCWNVKEIGDNVLASCPNFTGVGPNYEFVVNAKKIGDYFMAYNTTYNLKAGIQVYADEIGESFMAGCTSFNHQVFLNGTTKIGANFLTGCTSFNSNIVGYSLMHIGGLFLQNCTSYNQPLDFPALVTVETGFLRGCTAYNQPFKKMPSVVLIYGSGYNAGDGGFLYGLTSFNQDLDFSNTTFVPKPSGIIIPILSQCSAMTATVYVGDATPPEGTDTGTGTLRSFTASSNSVAAYTTGITIKGANRQAWLNKFPNNASIYRKLIDGGE